MKKNKIITWTVIAVIFAILSFAVYQYYFKEDTKSTLTLSEKQWIEDNKNQMIDLGITSNLTVFTGDGTGVLFDFLDDLEKNTKLEFNRVPFNKGDKATTDYSFEVVDQKGKNDILVYQDNYVLLTTNKNTYTEVRNITGLTIGTLKNDLEKVDTYLDDHNDLKYQTFNDVNELIKAIKESKVDAIVLPKMYYLSEIGTNSNLNVSYNITEMTKDYVIRLGKTGKLNTILKKYFAKWSKESFDQSFNDNFKSSYFIARNVDEETRSSFTSKKYIYGYVSNKPYHANIEGSLYGYNIKQIHNFAKMSDIEIEYREYQSYEDLIEAFNTNKIDFYYYDTSTQKFNIDTYETVALNDTGIVVVSPFQNEITVNTLNSLNGKTVATLRNSKIEQELKRVGAKVTGYSNVEALISHKNKTDILVLDYNSYQYYKNNELENYKIDYMTSLGGTGYIVRDIKANRAFRDYLNFYLSIANEKTSMSASIYSLLKIGNTPYLIKNLLIAFIAVVVIGLGYLGIKKYKEIKMSNPNISKTDKLKYIDVLTSLKNRAYLNDHIEAWDNSEVYPQTIIIVDLNNIAYINDNYGHQEGDVIIKEAANKLITTQIENSDIIRTNGNEFLIYLVGYTEKQIITYIRKLNKEMKDLSHGYGAAIGYSMIHDAIKTIDDAVNEATLDMRNNKEELNN